MSIPVAYVARNLWTRRLTTGEIDNVVVIRKGAETEIQSGITRDQAGVIEMHPAVAIGRDGERLMAKETVVLISLLRRGDAKPSNVVIRGTDATGLALRPQVKITTGRMFRAGTTEIVVGSSIAARFANTRIGQRLNFAQRDWTVVGVFDAGGSGFDSEIWGDVDQLMQSFRRTAYSSMVARLSDPGMFDGYRAEVGADPRLVQEMKREQIFYSDQSRALSTFINILGLTLSAIFSIGAMIGAMITMYASVANRVGEIGTLRALGFRRRSVLGAFLLEAALLGAVGGALGLALASLMQFASFSTTNFQTFADLSFRFILTPGITVKTVLFALAMGLIGGFLPAVRAARLSIVDALRAI